MTMETEELYNSWLKKMGEKKYEPKTIGELLEYSMNEKPEKVNAIIEGDIIDRNVQATDNYYYINLLVEGMGKGAGNAVVVDATETSNEFWRNDISNYATASISKVGDIVAIAGEYSPVKMQIKAKFIFNKSALNARKKQESGA